MTRPASRVRHTRTPSHQRSHHARPMLNFTIPSLHDDTVLDCRLYQSSHTLSAPPGSSPRRRTVARGAVVAHPYATLGGSYDDAVVQLTVDALVQRGFTVATFNFRGAGGSHGKTSWSARPEVMDYSSVVGLLVEYLHALACGRQHNLLPGNDGHENHRGPDSDVEVDLILGGYSYGSLIVSMLPSTEAIMAAFQNVPEGSTAAEISLRAHSLANDTLRQEEDEASALHRSSHDTDSNATSRSPALLSPEDAFRSGGRTLVVGGEETPSDVRKVSREHSGRRSLDAARKSLEAVPKLARRAVGRTSAGRQHSGDHSSDRDDASAFDESTVGTPTIDENKQFVSREVRLDIQTRYLLISPLLPPISAFLSFSPFSWLPRRKPHDPNMPGASLEHHITGIDTGKFLVNPALAVFGSKDSFTSGERLKSWAADLGKQRAPSTDADANLFEWEAIESADHFWREEGVAQALAARIGRWVEQRR